MIIVCIGWVIFRIEDLNSISIIIERMFIYHPFNLVEYIYNNYDLSIALLFGIFAIIGIFPIVSKTTSKMKNNIITEIFSCIILLTLFGINIILLLGNSYNPFIYFKF